MTLGWKSCDNPEYSGTQRRSVTKSTHLQGGPRYSVSRSLAATHKLMFSKLGVAKQLDQDEQVLKEEQFHDGFCIMSL